MLATRSHQDRHEAQDLVRLQVNETYEQSTSRNALAAMGMQRVDVDVEPFPFLGW